MSNSTAFRHNFTPYGECNMPLRSGDDFSLRPSRPELGSMVSARRVGGVVLAWAALFLVGIGVARDQVKSLVLLGPSGRARG